MFRNFIYFIVVLLIYTTYQPSKEPNFTPFETIFLFVGISVFFSVITRFQFRKLERQLPGESLYRLDHKFNAIVNRQAILAIGLFAINVYGLNMSFLFARNPLFVKMPTLQALLFLGLFIGYLSIVWFFGHNLYRRLYDIGISKKSYILSNIQFAIPVLLPWFFLSIITDIIHALPFPWPKQILATTEGQVVYFLVFLLGAAVLGPALVQKFWGCKPLEDGAHRIRIDGVCRKAGVKFSNILYWPIFGGRMITAGVMGLTKKFRYILVTDALLRFLEPEEIDAVIAHEIGHVKKKHLQFYLFFFIGYLLFSYAVFDLILFLILYSDLTYRFVDSLNFHQNTMISVVFSALAIIMFLFYFRYIFGYFMRNFERQADTYIYHLFDNAGYLITTLQKIAMTTGQPADRPNWHHFSIAERIGYLKKCEADRSWILRHDRKVKKSIAVYLIGLLIIGGVGYHLNFGETGQFLNNRFFEKLLQRELERTPDNPKLYSMLGDLYFSKKMYPETISAYERAIDLAPKSPQVLNNQAWLYATCEDDRYRNPERALQLAKKAAILASTPQILDTLAECYFINGYRQKAIETGEQALALARPDGAYFEKQLEKFRTAPP
jgi:Zn-dependent protease with chaperone function